MGTGSESHKQEVHAFEANANGRQEGRSLIDGHQDMETEVDKALHGGSRAPEAEMRTQNFQHPTDGGLREVAWRSRAADRP